jgi:quercetin dioxygenase-like cupin family protein
MRINADFSARVLVRFADTDWVASPAPGVARKMLDRIGDEVARATSLVRFAPGSAFAPHTHDGGEEYLVLEGVFQDESGDYPTGSYVRNPPTTRHRPAARDGATILVKLHQFDPDDRTEVHETLATDGRREQVLHRDAREAVRMEVWTPGQAVAMDVPGGLELFVLEGALTESGDAMGRWDWLRLPPGGRLQAVAGPDGARLWTKSGHLAGQAAAAYGV